MNLVIDYGNTNAKVGIFDHHTLIEKYTFVSQEQLKKFLQNSHAHYAIISTVSVDAELIADWVQQVKWKMVLTQNLPLPIKNLYATPGTLGVDRLAGACGAHHLFPGKNCLVIDLGSCMTFNFIDAEGKYFGGSIAPGMSMRFEAVHTFTARLPLVRSSEGVALIGNNTETSIQSGVINGMIAELDGLIGRYQEKYNDLKVILCGGDASFFENKLKAAIFASPELVLVGLNSILTYNVHNYHKK